MPGMDGTGPIWAKSKKPYYGTICNGRRRLLMCGKGYGRGMGFCRRNQTLSREMLQLQKENLQSRLSYIEKQLQNL